MKKPLLVIIYFLACAITMQAQILYGTTFNGGADGGGTIIKFLPAANNLTVAKSFERLPTDAYYSSFIQASDGKLYGMTRAGGSHDIGEIFSYDPLSGIYTNLQNFDNTNGARPYGSLMQASDGKLYGVTSQGGSSDNGVIFSFDPSSAVYTKLKDFDNTSGRLPTGDLIQASDGKLYGTTAAGGSSNAGVIFSFDPATSTYINLKNFDNTNGGSPFGGLLQISDRKLYGMTYQGGSSNVGVIYSFDPATSIYTKLKDFNNADGINPFGSLMQASDGKLYGMTNKGGNTNEGVVFSFDPSASVYTKLIDFNFANGANPYGSLIQATDGKLYGMTYGGNILGRNFNNDGVIFSFDPVSSAITVFQGFVSPTPNPQSTPGSNPFGSLVQAKDGKLYGMSNKGGIQGFGAIFSLDPSTAIYMKLRDFGTHENGSNAAGTVIQASDGKLYGMTTYGGIHNDGVIYSFDASTSVYTKLMDFDEFPSGANPFGSLVQASDGKLYGMTTFGGSGGGGVVFSYDLLSSTYKVLKEFSNGGNPYGSLIQASDGKLYGMSSNEGSYGNIFSFDPGSSVYSALKYFNNSNEGGYPYGNLLQAEDGKLYGMTSQRGALGFGGYGIIFSFDPSTSVYTNVHDFDYTNGANPYGSLIQANDGKLYGMTSAGGNLNSGVKVGVIFSFSPSNGTYTNLYSFDGINGVSPYGNLLQASDGKFYGMTYAGGTPPKYGPPAGVVFSFDPTSSTYTKLQDFNYDNGSSPYFGSGFIELKICSTNTTYYQDADGDSYGNLKVSIAACTQPNGYVTDSTDCDDNKASVHPGATEICGNGIDDNCNGQVDENCNILPTININDVSVKESKGVAVKSIIMPLTITFI